MYVSTTKPFYPAFSSRFTPNSPDTGRITTAAIKTKCPQTKLAGEFKENASNLPSFYGMFKLNTQIKSQTQIPNLKKNLILLLISLK